MTEAILGAEIDVPQQGEKFTIPEGTQPGTGFTMKSGIPYVTRQAAGGLILVSVEIPPGKQPQKEHIRSFAKSCGEHNYAHRLFKSFFNK